MTDKEAISNLNQLIYGIVSPDIQRSLDLAIKALEEKPTVEITEKQAILLLINNGWLVNHDKELREKWERPQGEWIPVSERLPDIEQDVLVCLTYKNTTHFAVTRLLNDKHWLCFSDVEVIAWQPLPEPYMEGEE
jgi:hypothetical protein